MKKAAADRRAVYAGTFDPITNGHQDIIKRALRVFDELSIAVVETPSKKTLLMAEDRVRLVEQTAAEFGEAAKRITVQAFSGLLVDHVRRIGCHVVIRGLRAVSDYEYEAQMAIINRHLADDIETVFLMTSDNCSFISSSVVREIAKYGGDISGLVPVPVAKHLGGLFAK